MMSALHRLHRFHRLQGAARKQSKYDSPQRKKCWKDQGEKYNISPQDYKFEGKMFKINKLPKTNVGLKENLTYEDKKEDEEKEEDYGFEL